MRSPLGAELAGGQGARCPLFVRSVRMCSGFSPPRYSDDPARPRRSPRMPRDGSRGPREISETFQ
eukprot:9046383-Pyramimonas_sp.AAC.1